MFPSMKTKKAFVKTLAVPTLVILSLISGFTYWIHEEYQDTVSKRQIISEFESTCSFIRPVPNKVAWNRHRIPPVQSVLIDAFVHLGDSNALNLRIKTVSSAVDAFHIIVPSVDWKNRSIPPLSLQMPQLDLGLFIWRIQPDPIFLKGKSYREYETHILDRAFNLMKSKKIAQKEGVMAMFGLVEQLPRAEVLKDLKQCVASFYRYSRGSTIRNFVLNLKMDRYLYGFQYKRLASPTIGSRIVSWMDEEWLRVNGTWAGLSESNMQDKFGSTAYDIENAGWHCDACYSESKEMMNRFGWHLDEIVNRVRYGVLMDNIQDPVRHVSHIGADIPLEVRLYQGTRYSHMMSRRNAFAGFRDIREELRLKNQPRHTCDELGAKDSTKKSLDPTQNRKLIDYFMYNGERDFLEIRLNTIGCVVDWFILVEMNRTFSGNPKNLTLFELKEVPEFRRYWDKIVHIDLGIQPEEIGPNGTSVGAFTREYAVRNGGLREGLKRINAKDGDLVIIGDVDEIPRPSTLETLKSCSNHTHSMFHTQLDFYYFGFEYRHAEETWGVQTIFVIDEDHRPESVNATSIRGNNRGKLLMKAGWHCSWCFSTLPDVLQKVSSYSHTDHNNPAFLGKSNILNGYRYGFDLFGRQFNQFRHIEDNIDVPDYVAANRERFAYMLDRRNEWSGFIDVKDELLNSTN